MKKLPARPPRRWLRTVQVAIAAVVGAVVLVPNAYAAAQPANAQKSATVAAVATAAKDDPAKREDPKRVDIWPGVTLDVGYHGCARSAGQLIGRASLPTDSEIDAAARPNRNLAIFWTGWAFSANGTRIIARCPAENFLAPRVQAPNGTDGGTLETALRRVLMPPPDDRSLHAERLWTRASQAFASRAAGVVRVVRGPNTRTGNVWDTYEYPILTRNGSGVTRILQYDMRQDGTLAPPREIWRNPATFFCGSGVC